MSSLLQATVLILISLFSSSFSNLINAAVPCIDNDDCTEFPNSTCDGFCINFQGVPHKITSNPAPITEIGLHCSPNSTQCIVNHSECNSNFKCACRPGFIASATKKKCLEIRSNLHLPCEESVQCPAKTKCNSNRCVCPEYTHMLNGSCFYNRQLGEKCATNEECAIVAGGECDGRCKCAPNYVADGGNDRCLARRQWGEECTRSLQCTATLGFGAYCSGGVCQCQELFHFDGAKCNKDYLLDEVCGSDEECHQPGHGESRLECLLGVCKCRDQFWEVHGYCVEKSAAVGLCSGGWAFMFVGFITSFIV